jgi:hypothetical protein
MSNGFTPSSMDSEKLPIFNNIAANPTFAKRGMHLNGWAFRSPYSFRAWSEAEWHNYIDMLNLLGVNLLYLWPFMEIIPLPVSTQDEEYLQEFRRVVDYAQTRHGMEVWMMQSANRVAQDDCGVVDPRLRPYWRPSQKDLDPADPAVLDEIMASRAEFYRIVNNVDGVCTIDSDPGGWKDSPITDFIKILNGCRDLLDEYNIHGAEAKIINWMWCGWGRTPENWFDPEHARATIRAMKSDMHGNWKIIAGAAAYLPICQEEGVLDRTIFLPYGTIEGEPAYPTTNLGFDGIREHMKFTQDYPGLLGVMGNVQCPLLQLPRTYYYLNLLWDTTVLVKSDAEVMQELALHLYPDSSQLIAACFLALSEQNLAKIEMLIENLEKLLTEHKLGPTGVLGQLLFPNPEIVVHALVMQLKLHAAAEAFCQQVTADADLSVCADVTTALLDAYLAWDTEHGWHDLWGRGNWPLGMGNKDYPLFGSLGDTTRLRTAVHSLRSLLGDAAAVSGFFNPIEKQLSAKHDLEHVAGDAVKPMQQIILESV